MRFVIASLLFCLALSSARSQTKNATALFQKWFPTPGPDDPISTSSTSTTEFSLQPAITPGTANRQDVECERPDGRAGVCVLYYQCDPETKKAITDGSTLLDIRASACPHYLETCCLHDAVNTTEPDTREPMTSTFGCGYSNPGAQAFRTSGANGEAQYGDFPWMVAIMNNTDPDASWATSYFGGGTLIHPKVVLTAAHKVEGFKPNQITCRAGEWDWKTTEEGYPFQERKVKKIIVHEDYYRPSVLNSMALLILEEPYNLSYAPHIDLACIGTSLPPQDTVCYGMGWGKHLNDNAYAVVLKKVELPLMGRTACNNALRRTRLGTHFQLHQSLMCAGGQSGVDTCKGDGGSPLVCHIGKAKDLRFAVVGSVAWGIGCGEDGIPGVYVNVPLFKNWIDAKMKEEGLPTDTYSY